jgi:hypothetical protein
MKKIINNMDEKKDIMTYVSKHKKDTPLPVMPTFESAETNVSAISPYHLFIPSLPTSSSSLTLSPLSPYFFLFPYPLSPLSLLLCTICVSRWVYAC